MSRVANALSQLLIFADAIGRVGTEHEKLVILTGTRERATYEQIAPVLRGLVDRHGWEAKMQGDNIFGALVTSR